LGADPEVSVLRKKDPITVVVGEFGAVIERGLLEVLGGARGLRVLGVGLDHAALEDAVARRKARVVVLEEDSAATSLLPRRLCGASRGGSHSSGRGIQSSSGVGLVVLAHRPTRAYVARLVAFGVTVCLSIDASELEIVRGVRLAAGGRHVFVAMSERPSRAARAVRSSALTDREREVLDRLSKGQRNAEIAEALRISVETARMHTKHLYRKLGVSSRGELLGIEL
jgi:DNA-binding NarL/FixJ family response regulator